MRGRYSDEQGRIFWPPLLYPLIRDQVKNELYDVLSAFYPLR
uniref:Uncharacterized protein n=3 Tax=Enterobacteriaceae TaxID=543 RepID=A0A0N7FVV9_ECOLX|nr:hypothetical protein pEC1929_0062 [Escherichia coli]AWU78719.1 hypothetical protein [Klebsiella pneumoniae]QBQ69657.1 hypothetical protein [Klebsiella aerogenes]WHE44523.1 hypothetical protein [Klebsiella quasipneumoniae]ANW07759.1 hypothetical protein [Escherichia coli]